MQIVNGKPAVLFYDGTAGEIKYAHAKDDSGSKWVFPVSIDAIGSFGYDHSMQIVNGNAAVVYLLGNKGLKYRRAKDIAATVWDTAVTVDKSGGYYPCLQMVNGRPAISYYDAVNGNLKFNRSYDSIGTQWGIALSIDGTGETGKYLSLKLVGSNPAISYYDGSNYDLKFVRALNSTGSEWGTPVIVDGETGLVGQYTSLQIVNGNPAISYLDVNKGDLKYVRANDAFGTSWGMPVAIDIAGVVGQYTTLMVVNGHPAISYFDVTNGDLKYVRALDVNGGTWGTPLSLDVTGLVGEFCSMAIVNGHPAIAYHRGNLYDLKYIRANDSNGSTWATPLSVVTATNTGYHAQLEVVNGNPAISYYDGTLQYVRATDASGSTWGAAVTVDGTGKAGRFNSLRVIHGKPAISYGVDANLQLKYIRAEDSVGAKWSTPVVLDSATGDVYSSMIAIGNKAAISYFSEAFPFFIMQNCSTPDITTNLSGITVTATEAEATYQWINCSDQMPVVAATHRSFTPAENGNYAVIINKDGCIDTSECVAVMGVGVRLNGSEIQSSVALFPNPTSGLIQIRNMTTESIVVYNSFGQSILKSEATNVLDISNEQAGLYFIQVLDKNGRMINMARFLKE